jgi:hypothetical protein
LTGWREEKSRDAYRLGWRAAVVLLQMRSPEEGQGGILVSSLSGFFSVAGFLALPGRVRWAEMDKGTSPRMLICHRKINFNN